MTTVTQFLSSSLVLNVCVSLRHFPGYHYSYETCGGESTFENWFGVNGTSATSYQLEDLADVVETYIKSLRRDIEDTYVELKSVTSYCDHSHTGCPCTDCEFTSGWGTDVNFDATMLKAHATTPVTARSTCLSAAMHTFFMKIAGSEYHDPTQFANLYGGKCPSHVMESVVACSITIAVIVDLLVICVLYVLV